MSSEENKYTDPLIAFYNLIKLNSKEFPDTIAHPAESNRVSNQENLSNTI